MKKIVLLSLVTLVTISLWAAGPVFKKAHKTIASSKANFSRYSRNNKPKSLRSNSLLTVPIGIAGNLLTVDNGNCHQIDVDSAMNTVIFIHRAESYNNDGLIGRYRYDISRNGGTTWDTCIGPLNPMDDEVNINGRFPQAVLRPDSAYPTNPDSAWIVYNGSWWVGTGSQIWQGQFYGVGKLDGDTTTYTQDTSVVNNANVEIATSMIESAPGNYWNLNLNYTGLTTTTDTIRGLIIEHGLWNNSAGKVLWTYQYVNFDIGSFTSTGGSIAGNNLGSPTIAFDPTGKYGWIVMSGNLTNGPNFASVPIYMNSSDYGQTWSAPQALSLGNLPGIFTTPSNGAVPTLGPSLAEDIQVAVDSAGNPHIFAVVGTTDTTNQGGGIYLDLLVLYDIYYNPAVVGCSWQANFLSQVWGFEGTYTADASTVGGTEFNRVQVSRSKDGTKLFVFWNDTDSADVVSILSTATTGSTIYSNPTPNLMGIGINMTNRMTTDIVDFTSGNSLFGGQMAVPVSAAGSIGGAMFPVVSPNALNLGAGTYNVPVVLTNPDYRQSVIASKLAANPAQFYYCQNINFTQSQYVNKFDNAPPTLALNGPDTVYVHLDSPYVHPTPTAYDCVFGNITPQYSSNVPTDIHGNTDSVGVYTSTWTATNPDSNSSTVTQVVIVAAKPIARFVYTALSGYRYAFTDTSLNFPTSRVWNWGDGTSNHLNATHPIKVYTTGGTKCVTLTVSNQFGTSDTVSTPCLIIHLAGINDETLSNKIVVYPNPSAGTVNMDLADDIATGATVTAYNMLGQQVNAPINIRAGITQTVLDLSNLETGVYMLKVETTSGTAVKEITINK
jgi:hypothetical protein